ncbi:hypothetical protein Fmac_016010 [Flemingia macrophylla]|uniref:F-box domain-containing protein n=1 Tax=Flemingia macrophylla TaxID=520843 RepID=A0ABD1MG60_9FABA
MPPKTVFTANHLPPESRRELTSGQNRDMISTLPDTVLLHIMSFMDTKHAVQTSVLSKQWKLLCKQLTTLTFAPDLLQLGEEGTVVKIFEDYGFKNFKNFACWVLCSRNHSYSLLNLTVVDPWTDPELLDLLIEYALLSNIQHLVLYSTIDPTHDYKFLSLIFCCHSLTSLSFCNGDITLPQSLHLPALKFLHLTDAIFTANENGSVDPFSNCHVLDTLILHYCSLRNYALVLCVSNYTLASLVITGGLDCQTVLSTPNLVSFHITGSASHQLFSTCDLCFLRDVYIDMGYEIIEGHSLIIFGWLQVLANVRILEISWRAFQVILHDMSMLASMRSQPPSFARLESLIVNKLSTPDIDGEKVNTAVEYLLQKSPMAKVDIIEFVCPPFLVGGTISKPCLLPLRFSSFLKKQPWEGIGTRSSPKEHTRRTNLPSILLLQVASSVLAISHSFLHSLVGLAVLANFVSWVLFRNISISLLLNIDFEGRGWVEPKLRHRVMKFVVEFQ